MAVFAFGYHAPTIDTNVRRVVSRWNGEPLAGVHLTAAAELALDTANAAKWNQAVMDLSSSTCLPRNPACGECPITDWCAGPDVTIAVTPQPRFEGSLRQVRGAVVRSLVRTSASERELVKALAVDPSQLRDAIAGLEADGLITIGENGMIQLAD